MKSLTIEQQLVVNGGTDCTAVDVIGAISCFGAMFWPIGTLMFGPTCGGMIFASLRDCN